MKKLVRGYLRVVELICMVMMGLILACMVIQIGCRLLSISQSFTEELAKLCFSVMIFIGAPMAMAEGCDISVDMLVNKLPAAPKRIVETLANLLGAVFAVLVIRSFGVFMGANNGVTSVSMTWIKMNWLYGAFRISFGLLAVVCAVKAVCAALGKAQVLDINEEEKKRVAEAEKELDIGI